MLQQTQAPRVAPVFAAFLSGFPTVGALARSSAGDVVRAWAGLGYNRRAVALHRCAQAIVSGHGGRVPREVHDLVRLPGIGPYTAGAVASIAFGEPVVAVDTNVRRIVARVALGGEPDEVPARALADSAEAMLDIRAPGDWNQALMDLGREVCRRDPRCEACPLATVCRFRASGRAGRSSVRRQSRFEGSGRQVRGRVVATLRGRRSASVDELAAGTGFPAGRIQEALDGLARDGVVEITRRGRAKLPA